MKQIAQFVSERSWRSVSRATGGVTDSHAALQYFGLGRCRYDGESREPENQSELRPAF